MPKQPWKIPRLPVLTPENSHTYPKWHTYYKAVYHHKVSSPVDLNLFTWFYWTAPFEIMPIPRFQLRPAYVMTTHQTHSKLTTDRYHAFWLREKMLEYSAFPEPIKKILTLKPGDAFIGPKVTSTNVALSLMRLTALYGFFVCRNPMNTRNHNQKERMEIMHVLDDWRSTYSSWYWHVRGSGVFLQKGEFIHDKEYLQITHRDTLALFQAKSFPTLQSYDNMDIVLPKWMRKNHIRMLHIDSAHGVPEIIIIDPLWDTNSTVHNAIISSTLQHRGRSFSRGVVKRTSPLFRHTIRTPQHEVNIDSIAGVKHQYITIGDHRVIRKRRIDEFAPILTVMHSYGSTPVWISSTSYRLIQFIRQHAHRDDVDKYLQTHVQRDPRLLNRWVPVHLRQYRLHRQSRQYKSDIKHQFVDTVCTPLAFAALCGHLDLCAVLLKYNASVSVTCPDHFKGEDESSYESNDVDVAHYLHQVLPKLFSKKDIDQIWNTIFDGSNSTDQQRILHVRKLSTHAMKTDKIDSNFIMHTYREKHQFKNKSKKKSG